ncbi:hypothetical protein ACMC9I_09790 [Deinococcota bacterium DY0809b]
MKDADRIRSYLRERFAEAEAKGLSVVCVKAGDVHKQLGLVHQFPNVVQVMKQFLSEAHRDFIAKQPPSGQGSDVIYVFRLPRPYTLNRISITSPSWTT